jgi:hypothetical protein
MKAIESMSKRIYPNWVNCDWSGNIDDLMTQIHGWLQWDVELLLVMIEMVWDIRKLDVVT